jgi:hypothetical protein
MSYLSNRQLEYSGESVTRLVIGLKSTFIVQIIIFVLQIESFLFKTVFSVTIKLGNVNLHA